ncbi:hypothetical protein [Desulfurobacterium sp.]
MRVTLYLPDDKKELYEQARELLEKNGRSVSQLFLEALQDYIEKSSKEIKVREKVLDYIAVLFSSIAPEVSLVKEKVGNKRPDFIVEIEEFGVEKIAVIVVKNVPIMKEEVKKNEQLLSSDMFSHEEIAEDFIPILIKKKIPLLIIFYTSKDGEILKIDVIDILGFLKREVFPFKETKKKVTKTLKEAIVKAIRRIRNTDEEFTPSTSS